jgi:hypothetical protein
MTGYLRLIINTRTRNHHTVVKPVIAPSFSYLQPTYNGILGMWYPIPVQLDRNRVVGYL